MGQDLLALYHPKFDVKSAAATFPLGTPIGVLDWTFGTSAAPLVTLLDNIHSSLVRVHLINAVCIRNQNCGRYEVGNSYTKKSFNDAILRHNASILGFVRTRTQVYKEIRDNYKGKVVFLISPALEHDLSREAYRILADTVKDTWPEVQLVNSADGGIAVEQYKGALIEQHGVNVHGRFQGASLDGDDAREINLPKWKADTRNTVYRFIWASFYNCRKSGVFIDPRKRVGCPNPLNFKRMNKLAH